MGFCNFQGDNVINQYLKNQLRGSDKIKIVNYPDISASEAVGYIAGADFIVATRETPPAPIISKCFIFALL